MQQKVWVVDDPNWEGPPVKRVGDPSGQAEPPQDNPAPVSSSKNPAVSFSMSMLVWGSGHIYSGAYGVGAVLMVSMLVFFSPIFVMLLFRDVAGPFEAEIGFPTLFFVSGVVVYLFVGLVCWLGNAVDAYNRTQQSRNAPFYGVDNEHWPLLGSLIFPGWGQYLNGQTGKGIFFLCCGGLGLLSGVYAGLVLYAWPGLEADSAGLAFEISLIAAFVLIPVCLLIWLVSIYDAFISCRELFIEKFRQYPSNARKRKRDKAKHLIPRWNAVLVLLLAISVGMQCFPRTFYVNTLETIRTETLHQHLQLIPRLVDKALKVIDR